jgi:hypothetical protein
MEWKSRREVWERLIEWGLTQCLGSLGSAIGELWGTGVLHTLSCECASKPHFLRLRSVLHVKSAYIWIPIVLFVLTKHENPRWAKLARIYVPTSPLPLHLKGEQVFDTFVYFQSEIKNTWIRQWEWFQRWAGTPVISSLSNLNEEVSRILKWGEDQRVALLRSSCYSSHKKSKSWYPYLEIRPSFGGSWIINICSWIRCLTWASILTRIRVDNSLEHHQNSTWELYWEAWYRKMVKWSTGPP